MLQTHGLTLQDLHFGSVYSLGVLGDKKKKKKKHDILLNSLQTCLVSEVRHWSKIKFLITLLLNSIKK